MLNFWLGLALKSKAAKMGGTVVGGGAGILAILWPLFSYQSQQVSKEIDHADKAVREFVNLKHDNVMTEIKHISKGQQEIKEMLKTTNQRLFEIKQNTK